MIKHLFDEPNGLKWTEYIHVDFELICLDQFEVDHIVDETQEKIERFFDKSYHFYCCSVRLQAQDHLNEHDRRCDGRAKLVRHHCGVVFQILSLVPLLNHFTFKAHHLNILRHFFEVHGCSWHLLKFDLFYSNSCESFPVFLLCC